MGAGRFTHGAEELLRSFPPELIAEIRLGATDLIYHRDYHGEDWPRAWLERPDGTVVARDLPTWAPVGAVVELGLRCLETRQYRCATTEWEFVATEDGFGVWKLLGDVWKLRPDADVQHG